MIVFSLIPKSSIVKTCLAHFQIRQQQSMLCCPVLFRLFCPPLFDTNSRPPTTTIDHGWLPQAGKRAGTLERLCSPACVKSTLIPLSSLSNVQHRFLFFIILMFAVRGTVIIACQIMNPSAHTTTSDIFVCKAPLLFFSPPVYANFFTVGRMAVSKSSSEWSVALMWMPTPFSADLMASLLPE